MNDTPEKYKPVEPYWHDEPYLRTLYADRGLSIKAVSNRVDAGRNKVRDVLAGMGIEIRSPGKGTDSPDVPESTELDWTDVTGEGEDA